MSASIPLAPPPKRPSRSNSTSSSMTVKKSTPASSKAAPRPSYLRGRSTSPDSITRVLHSLNSSRTDIPRTDVSERKHATGFNVNRWSHSTSSSISAIDAELVKKRTSSSGAVRRSVAGYNTLSENASSSQKASNRQTSPRRKSTKKGSAATSPVEGSRLNFQDSSNLNVVKDLAQSSSAASTDFFGSPWEHRTGLNKFGEPVSGLSIQYTTDPNSLSHYNSNGAMYSERRASPSGLGHRDRSANQSKDTSRASTTSDRSNQSRKGHRSPKQKDMLSKALAKANSAVLMDNAQDIEGAIEAYNEACVLLEQVMVRSLDLEDRRKLSAIRTTYSDRIAELHDLNQSFAELLEKELPDEPSLSDIEAPEDYYNDGSSVVSRPSKDLPAISLPLRQESLLPQIFGGEQYLQEGALPTIKEPSRSPHLQSPMDAQYMPQPLTPRHPSPKPPRDPVSDLSTYQLHLPATSPDFETMAGNTSWLDNLDGASSRASSRLSTNEIGQHNGQLVSDIEAEFDAMNAAIDIAYEDQGSQEPTPRTGDKALDFGQQGITSRQSALHFGSNRFNHLSNEYLDDDAELQERMLEEVTRESGLDTSAFDQRMKQTLPRQSDSSGFSSRTWGSSVASTVATSGTALSTLAEANEASASLTDATKSPSATQGTQHTRTPSQLSRPPSTAEKHIPIRDRRMSGQDAKQLKIETFMRRTSLSHKPMPVPPSSLGEPLSEAHLDVPHESSSPTFPGKPLTPLTSVQSTLSNHENSPDTPALTQDDITDELGNGLASPTQTTRAMPPPPVPGSRKATSSSNVQKTSLTINTQPALVESPGTPGSAMFGSDIKRQLTSSTPAVTTPGGTLITSGYGGGLYLFDDQVNGIRSPQSPVDSDPATLEPCPEAYLLRPFWLMRCLYQALSHPNGGYVTQKLFVPRDIWRVRNVKIKALDDKVSTCDLLCAALQKLSRVDTLDANAVLEEMQSFETILDHARGVLAKKLGNDVGLAGTKTVFSNSPATEDPDTAIPRSGNPSSAAKSLASGWRKLRSKSSSANLNSNSSRDGNSQVFTMPTLPMTPSSSVALSRSYLSKSPQPPPTPSKLPNMIASHAIYLSSLSRLFEAVQILDSIARQVEDPGLKHSSQTHVGLELCVRNAAEFFGFYVVRFVMGDLLLLIDKFLKRGSEWVMT